MSHFCVLVIGPEPEQQLAPYHEFECTGEDNQYVQDIDQTDEVLAEYETRGADYRDDDFPTWVGKWHGKAVVPEGEEPDLGGKHKYGYVRLVKSEQFPLGRWTVIDRTNPDAKWDWYQIGGRWTGYFKMRAHVTAGALGQPGIQTMEPGYKPPAADRADQCFKADIDIEGMRNEAGQEAATNWDDYHALVDPHPPIVPWPEFQKRVDAREITAEQARTEYHAQPGIQALNKDPQHRFIWGDNACYAGTRERCIELARNRALTPFAVVKDSQWFEKGSMGWWGCVSDEKDQDAWNAEFAKLIDGLPDDTLFTLVDCHI